MTAHYGNYTRRLNSKIIRKIFRGTVMKEGREITKLYRALQSSFSTKNRVKIRRKTGSGRSPVDGRPGTIYSAVGSDKTRGSVLVWLEDGTDIRYRRMSTDWISKTSPRGGITMRPGRGRALGFGVFKGIEPRNFRDDIVQGRYPIFIDNAQDDFDDMFKSARWT